MDFDSLLETIAPYTPIIGTIAGLGGSYLQYKSSKDADEANAQAAAQADARQQNALSTSRADQAPWLKAGGEAVNLLMDKIKAGPGEFNPADDPGYKFGYQQMVEKPVLGAASAQGRLGGGRTMKELTRYASDYGSQKYDSFLDRYYNSLTPLQSMAGIGQTTANTGASNLMAYGGNAANSAINAGNSRATGYINRGNIMGKAMSDTGQNLLDYYYNQKKNPYGYLPI